MNKGQKRTNKKLKKQIQGHEADKEFILENVKHNIEILKYVDKQLLEEKQFITDVINESNGMALKYASEEIKDEKSDLRLGYATVKVYSIQSKTVGVELENGKITNIL